MKKTLFSVIIPTLNEEHFLPKLLFDLEQQKDKDFEIIIVDGRSEDRTRDIVRAHKTHLPISLITVRKRNVSHQRNFGGKKAKGEFLIFLDADTRVEDTFIRKVRRHIRKDKAKLFIPTLVGEKNVLLEKALLGFTNSFVTVSHFVKKPISAGGCIFVDRTLFFSLRGFDEKLYLSEDHNFVQRACKRGYQAKVLRDVKVLFSLRRIEREGMLLFIYKNMFAYFHQLSKGNTSREIFNYEMGGHLYSER